MHKLIITIITLALTAQYVWAQPQTSKSSSAMPPYPLEKSSTKASAAMPIDPYGKKGAKAIRTKLTSLGFTVASMKKVGPNRWQVTTSRWNKSRAIHSSRGMISIDQRSSLTGKKCLASPCGSGKSTIRKGEQKWDPTDKVKNQGKGTIMIEVDEDGFITLRQTDLKSMGLQAHPHKMQGKFSVK